MDELPTSNLKFQNKSQGLNQKFQGERNGYDLRERLLRFAKRMLQICKMLPKIPECEGIRKQLANAGTSAGANFEEADGALTRKDFVNKVGISRKEAKETRYWLRVISGTYIEESNLVADIGESGEIVKILSTILINSGARTRRL